ncbi:hypothetical protein [Paucibacter soli]|uniref:hypothetical protein n=1 Tax=Paucibacter soli TaxID=3133433 RepID=UPI00309D850A
MSKVFTYTGVGLIGAIAGLFFSSRYSQDPSDGLWMIGALIGAVVVPCVAAGTVFVLEWDERQRTAANAKQSITGRTVDPECQSPNNSHH